MNTRLACDWSVLLPKNQQNKPKENIKLIYKIRNELKTFLRIKGSDKNSENGRK